MVRFKNRYLLCAIDSENSSEADIYGLQSKDIMAAVRSSLAINFGELAVGQLMSSLAMKLWSPALGIFLIRSCRDHFRLAWGAITFVTEIKCAPQLGQVRMTVLHVGGTIRACQKSAEEHGRKLIFQERNNGHMKTKLESAVKSTKWEMDLMEI
ncbi:Ribonuclease P/MRP protein subunit POP5 [Gracilariopsis chorda]|uniref:Ribonuclease P/MRP protein subunit POP5 n=1 Tax=Gracilariopsis chorda TaxID=448386 RepID=A0A2V3ICL2_9FLOR|nr:Ribonuclease P/MRP protein subunit POP5 [Gracilariopsis chorda]|eukprot:PXF39824.1 Ribonuclease P/MRP protein subunit POP5 [Gracilariopsis chorda]